MGKKKGQRKLRNFLLQPILQLRFGFYTIFISIIFAFVFSFVVFSGFDRLFEFVLDLTDARDHVVQAIKNQFDIMAGWLIVITSAYMVMMIGAAILFTHKLIGPTVAFRRHIRSIIDGNYSSRVVLRKGDAFMEVADDLNELAEKLAKKR